MKPTNQLTVLWCTLVILVGVNRAQAEPGVLQEHEVVPAQEVLITDLVVVDSERAAYPGPWSFGHLLEQAFGKDAAPRVVREWLSGWERGSVLGNNERLAAARPGLRTQLVEPWQKADGYSGDGSDWTPNLGNAPFRLLAIVNRMDLALPLQGFEKTVSLPPRRSTYRAAANLALDSSAGEARLVFGVTDQDGTCPEAGTTIIFEFGLDVIGSRQHLFEWAAAWHSLGAHDTIDADYLASLESVTRAFSDRRSVDPKPEIEKLSAEERLKLRQARRALGDPLTKRLQTRNGLPLLKRLAVGNGSVASQLMRIRVNDGSFGAIREFREFHVGDQGFLPAVLAGTPRESFFEAGTEGNESFGKWLQNAGMTQSKIKLLRDGPGGGIPSHFNVPRPQLALVSTVPTGKASYHWDGPGVERRLRHAFSRQTCCGCHCGDTGTEFFHIAPRAKGEVAKLSPFLQTGDAPRWVRDPAGVQDFSFHEMKTRLEAFGKLLTAAPDDN